MIKTPVNTIFSVMIIEEICKIVKKKIKITQKNVSHKAHIQKIAESI